MADKEATNPYIALREAKIARNEARLAQLGLLRQAAPLRSNSGANAQKNTKKRQPVVSLSTREPVRRSSRLSRSVQPDYKEVLLPVEGSHMRRATTPAIEDAPQTSSSSISSAPATVLKQSVPAANSVRSIDIDINALVLGEHKLLGQMMDQPGKEYVINKAFELASSSQDKYRLTGARLSFNKYCGVQEWGNAIFLWINLGSKDNSVVNDFLDNGKRITWYGGSRMYDYSPVIHKLLKFGKEATKMSSNILLWCRRYDTVTKKFTPYICLGRLSYESHQPGSQPLAFVWNLIDADLLKNHSESYLSLIQM